MSRESSRDGVRLIPTIPLKLDYNRIKGFIMNNTRRITLFGLVVFSFAVTSSVADDQTGSSNLFKSPRETLSLDQGWRFHLGNVTDAIDPGYGIKIALRAGDNVIALGVKNNGGEGGLNHNMKVELVSMPTNTPWSSNLFNGLAQVILQSQRGGSGNLVLRAKAEGLKPAETTISVEATPLYIHRRQCKPI
jgi:hypothetical protein